MAVLNGYDGTGFGKLLLNFEEKVFLGLVNTRPNTRKTVLPFYKKCGCPILGEIYRTIGTGNHFITYKQLI